MSALASLRVSRSERAIQLIRLYTPERSPLVVRVGWYVRGRGL